MAAGAPRASSLGSEAAAEEVEDDSPLVVREKDHIAAPMTLDQALYEMELVGHDFYLFHDAASDRPSVVYRRRGYDYGVIRLTVEPDTPSLRPASACVTPSRWISRRASSSGTGRRRNVPSSPSQRVRGRP